MECNIFIHTDEVNVIKGNGGTNKDDLLRVTKSSEVQIKLFFVKIRIYSKIIKVLMAEHKQSKKIVFSLSVHKVLQIFVGITNEKV